MSANQSFTPRLMAAPTAARYLDVDLHTFFELDLPNKRIGKKRLYDKLELDTIDEGDILEATRQGAIDKTFGIKRPIPDVSKIPDRETFQRQPIRSSVRRAVMLRDGPKCRYCGAEQGPWELDHVFPSARGGESTEDNLVVACKSCNLEKRDQTPEEWLGEQ